MVLKRLLRIVLLVILLAGVIYGVKNYHQVNRDNKVLGEWERSSEKLVDPILKRVDEGIGYFSGTRVEVPEAGSSGNSNKEVVANNAQEMVDQLIETVKELPEKQVVKIKEQIIQEIFPDCECTCSIVKDDSD